MKSPQQLKELENYYTPEKEFSLLIKRNWHISLKQYNRTCLDGMIRALGLRVYSDRGIDVALIDEHFEKELGDLIKNRLMMCFEKMPSEDDFSTMYRREQVLEKIFVAPDPFSTYPKIDLRRSGFVKHGVYFCGSCALDNSRDFTEIEYNIVLSEYPVFGNVANFCAICKHCLLNIEKSDE